MPASDGFHDSKACAFMRLLEANATVLREECLHVPVADYEPWPQVEAYSGTWSVFPLVGSGDDPWFSAACRENASRCPRTLALLGSIPGLRAAAYSRLGSASHVYLHADESTPATLRCHLGLDVGGEDSGLRVADASRRHADGRCLGFESRRPHEAFNGNARDRVVLVVDVDARFGR